MTLTVLPPTPSLTSQESAVKAFNQLLSLVVGRDIARATEALKGNTRNRTQECIKLTMADYKDAMDALATDPTSQSRVKQCQRKLDSLNSLQVFSNVLNEVEW